MDPGVLKEVAGVLESLGGDAKDAFVWYMIAIMVKVLVEYLLTGVTVLAALGIVARTILAVVRRINGSTRLAHAFGRGNGEWDEASLQAGEAALRAARGIK